MRVQVRLGSGLATTAGARRLFIELPHSATVSTLLDRLAELEPRIAPGLDSALPVVRGTQVGRAERLADGDEVAVLIPVAGGADPTSQERSSPWP